MDKGSASKTNMEELNIAVTCFSNMNRSMEAHAYLAKRGFKVKSFGTGDKVRLPGLSPDKPNSYDFGTPYVDIYKDLVAKNRDYYNQNGLLHMLERNRRIKPFPERFQDSTEQFDVIFTCEERVYFTVIDWFNSRLRLGFKYVHIVNIDIEDNPEDATIGAFLIFYIAELMIQTPFSEIEIDYIIQTIKTKHNKHIKFHTTTY